MSIRTKLLVTYLAVVTLGIFVLGINQFWSSESYFKHTTQTELTNRNRELCTLITEPLGRGDVERVERLVEASALDQVIGVRVISPSGALIATSSPETDRQLTDWSNVSGVQAGLQRQHVSGSTFAVIGRGDRLFDALPIVYQGRVIGVLRMAITLDSFRRHQRDNLFTLALAAAITFVLCALVSVWLAREMADPIRRMRNFALQVAAGRFDEKLDVAGRDELAELAHELNRMSAELASLDRERKRFLADVSHELRTPVTNVTVALEAFSKAEGEPELRERFLRAAQDEVQRLRTLVQDLLDLGRLEAGVVTLEPQPTRLDQLVQRTVWAVEPRCRAQALTIRQDVPEVSISVDPERMTQALMNLLDNAVKYSRRESTISIRAHEVRGFITIEIADRGPGISEDALPHIFDPFYIGDQSRSGRSTGLGLAITQRIVEAHGGTITVNSSRGEGTRVTVTLPLAQPGISVQEPASIGLVRPREEPT